MHKTAPGFTGDGCTRRGEAAGVPAARLLSLSAAPTFLVMALWSAFTGATADAMCMSGNSLLSPGGMTIMYTLMGVFHMPPWLALLPTQRNT